jgi:hypothetical protein
MENVDRIGGSQNPPASSLTQTFTLVPVWLLLHLKQSLARLSSRVCISRISSEEF